MSNPIGTATSMLIAVGVGGAVSVALEPDFVDIRQQSWRDNQNLVLDPGTLASLVAQGAIDLATGEDQATYSGISADRFDELVWLEQHVPGTAELMFLWRLGYLDEGEWRFGMTKHGVRQDFIDRLAKTRTVPLTAAEVAVAIHHHVIENQGQLPGLDLNTTGKVLRFPLVDIDAYASAEAYGYSHDQLDALTRTLGLPPGLDLVARAVFRGILDRGDFTLAALQSNRRTEWQEFEFEAYRQILTSHDYAELELRGFLTEDERHAATAKHGMSREDSDLLYSVLGRAPALSTIIKGLARGGTFNGPIDHIPEVGLSAMQRSNTRPEYYNIVWAARYSYPSPFVIRSLAEAGDLGDAKAVAKVLEEVGWNPELATSVAAKWVPDGTAADPHITKAKTQLWSTVHTAYVDSDADDVAATAALELVGVEAAAIPDVLALWQAERTIHRRTLSVPQLKKAVADALKTAAQAHERLLELGYSTDDADVLLAE
jgi:hypothetical protein